MEKDLQLYEIDYILEEKDEKNAEDFAASIKSKIVDNHGIVVSDSNPKFRHFSYLIKGKNGGYFSWVKFLLNVDSLDEIKKYLSKDKTLIRFLLIKLNRQILESSPRKKIVQRKEKTEPEEKRVDIEEIDKKLEEILGTN